MEHSPCKTELWKIWNEADVQKFDEFEKEILQWVKKNTTELLSQKK